VAPAAAAAVVAAAPVVVFDAPLLLLDPHAVNSSEPADTRASSPAAGK
jgi:hypothetical protein